MPRLLIFPLILTLVSTASVAEQNAATTKSTPTPAPAVAPAPSARMAAAAKRNENVAVFLIDTNAVKESNIRIGATPTAVSEATVESQWFAAEHGRPASEILRLRGAQTPGGWHGNVYYDHQNSVMNARTFFQVGGVKPSRRNQFGIRTAGLLPGGKAALTASFGQNHVRGMVNGNVLVPLATERTPLTTDPALRAMIGRYLQAFPNELPNRPDFDSRALNTNSPQRIDDTRALLRLDLYAGPRSKILLSHGIDRQRILAFQFVAGQNPNTELHTHRSRITWEYTPAASTTVHLAASFNRTRSVLVSEPNAIGPRIRFGTQIEDLGPDSMFPVSRATNTFRYGGGVTRLLQGGRHSLTFGGEYGRFQLNGIESNNERGYYQFMNNYGRSAIQNFLMGAPSMYEVTVGELSRGYRNWNASAYVADQWRVHSRLQLTLGLRYSAESAPYEVNGIDVVPYSCDCNNFSPRVSLAWQAGGGWTARAMYTTTFAQILPVTYQQVRNNPPNVYYIMVADPKLINPLAGINLNDAGLRHTPTWLSPDMVSPYSHQYNAGVERRIAGGALLRVNYIGSRTFKLLNSYIMNRAEPVAGLPLTSATVDARRPDSRYYETRNVLNGGAAWFDAGQVALDLPLRKGLTAGAGYTFSKALDQGPDFSGTAANRDILTQRSQWQYESLKDRKGLSTFDSPHALQFNYAWELPPFRGAAAFWRGLTSGWSLSGVNLWKMGTPLTLFVGSDSPGFGNVDGGPSDRPNIVDPSILGKHISHPNIATTILQRSRFSFITPGERRGNLGRNNFRKASIWNWNASISRQFRLPREWVARVSAEAYNLSNTPQFDEPQRNLSSQAFGKITNTLNDGRIFQIGFRLVF